ncbi:ATP-binding cassette domain-containing protein [Pyrobaculum aerophilum]|uniref:Nitrate ABC transporter ATP-binding protein n=1 Tax=Pyrobaculum aerophilum TaxID=13773 RepID=A0A371R0Z1_9CREN|nr:ABC transporter ATP-binding protein [Pyrobaculum aerophilum]RFA97127.1 nitrate ABC transporter ATP-binding protein [Pyrobaculum aerophilum]RFA98077.1 nitrate ABC transporter ATP-binding protein [Pyrobaculum aerophilum]
MLRLIDVYKKFDHWVLKGVALEVRGKALVYGHNGSGKTTLVKIAAGLLEPTKGRVERGGKLGVSLQYPLLHPDLTVDENLSFFAKAVGAEHSHIVEELGLRGYLHVRFAHLSYGWRKRADLARAMLGNPDVLILDEPLLGLDPSAREVVIDVVNRHRGPALITASTPCDYLAVKFDEYYYIHDGRLIQQRPQCSSS